MPVEFNDITGNVPTGQPQNGPLTDLVVKAHLANNPKAANTLLLFTAILCLCATGLMFLINHLDTKGPSQADIERANQLFIISQQR